MFVQAAKRFRHKPPPVVVMLVAKMSRKRKRQVDYDARDEDLFPVESKRPAAPTGNIRRFIV